MENRGYSIYEIGILGGNDKGEIKFILFLMFYYLIYLQVLMSFSYQLETVFFSPNIINGPGMLIGPYTIMKATL